MLGVSLFANVGIGELLLPKNFNIILANELIQHDLAVMTFDPILMDRPPKLNPGVHFEKDFERFIQVDLIINATGAVDPEAKLPVTVTMISI